MTLERVRRSGLFFEQAGQKFHVRGVSYGPFRGNSLGEPFPDKSVVERDFALLRELGANTLRLYHVPPDWFWDLAASFDLRLLVGIPWAQHIRFLDSRSERDAIRGTVREAAQRLRHAPNLFALLIGNEIPPQTVRWYEPRRVERFLATLADEVRQADPEALVSYANFPMTEYLELGFLDFFSFNVYLHRDAQLRRYLARLQNLAGVRPLLISEYGIDSIREGVSEQAEIVARTATTLAQTGCAGGIAFSFTDEWFTGGHDVADWAFGLVTADRRPKPAFESLRRVFHAEHPQAPDPAPKVSVVICAFDAERTLEECLESLRHLRYPRYEVIVVNDGSTDGTRAIAERFPEFRLVDQENRGLSEARNVGLLQASGEIIAYTDSDCAVDPDWLTFLVDRLVSSEFAGVGGPNLPPPEDAWMANLVARSPGGPTHVLLSDHEAEHVPGCNMAFWRDKLLEVGLFDPVYRAAGDDVDICWRLEDAGYKIGFAASALVWHRRRHTLRAYLKQQRGYGRAEALLYFKHPHRFNGIGQSRWRGRIYSDLGSRLLSRRPVIYGGSFGRALFQTLYEPPSSLLRSLPSTLEWSLIAASLIVAGLLLPLVGVPLESVALAGAAMFAVAAAQALSTALAVDCAGLPALRSRGLIAILTYLGPLLRAVERHRIHLDELTGTQGVDAAEDRPPIQLDLLRRRFTISYWSEFGIEKDECLGALIEFLRPRRYPLVLDDGWKTWDFLLYRGVWIRGEAKILVQNHGGNRRQVDVGLHLRPSVVGKSVKWGCIGAAALGIAAGSGSLLGVSLVGLLVNEAVLVHQASHLARGFHDAVATSFRALSLLPLSRPGACSDGPGAPEEETPGRAPV